VNNPNHAVFIAFSSDAISVPFARANYSHDGRRVQMNDEIRILFPG